MWIQINGKFLDKERETAKTSSIENQGEDEQKTDDALLWEDLESTIDNLEVTEDCISLGVNNKLGYFSLEIPINSETLEEILNVTIKKMNKLKSLIENLK